MSTKKGLCLNTEENTWVIRYLCPEGGGLAYCEIPVQLESYPLCQNNIIVNFELISETVISGGLQSTSDIGGKGLEHHQGKSAKIISEDNAFDKLSNALSNVVSNLSSNFKKLKKQSQPRSESDIIPGQLFFTKEAGWIIRYNTKVYKHKGSHFITKSISVHPKQFEFLSDILDHEKFVIFTKEDFYVEPPPNIHSNRGDFNQEAKIIMDETDIELFNPDTHSHEVFAIKDNEAFIGYKLSNGNFHFKQIPFTQPKETE